jgi:TorA maturation chaperone TorD
MLKTLFAIEDDAPPTAAAKPVAPSPVVVRDECAARAGVYRLLSGVFVEEPGVDFLAALRSDSVLQSLADAGVTFDADFTATPLETLAEQLACEYTTLFAASGGFPPVESVRLTGRYQQDPHFQVGETYARCGFVLEKGRFAVFADQLGVELMFVAELLERCASALDAGNTTEYKRLEREIKRFWTLHLGRWVRGYSGLVARAAQHSFYREMARFLAGFAEEEVAAMALRIEDLDQGRAVVPKSGIQVEFNPDEPVCGGCGPAPKTQAGATVHALHDLR